MTEDNPRPYRGGPRTPEGKKRSSINALKHGLTAVSPQALEAIATNRRIDYEVFSEQMRSHYRPQDALEHHLVNRIIRCLCRLSISQDMEQRLLERNPTAGRPGISYERVMKYERLVDIHLHRAIAALHAKRRAEGKIK